jgi:hypothetical protein
MYRRALAFTVVAMLGTLGATGLSASAFASSVEVAPHSISVPSVAAVDEVPAVAPAGVDDVVVMETSTTIPEKPVAEESSAPDAPVIMVTGLAVLLAAILMVVRSGSSRRLDEE